MPEDPLELPAEATLLDVAANDLMGKLKQVLKTACERHGDRFAAQMQRAEASGDAVGAVDSGIKYLFAYPRDGRDTGKVMDYLRHYLGAENDLVDLRRLLQTHCHVLQK